MKELQKPAKIAAQSVAKFLSVNVCTAIISTDKPSLKNQLFQLELNQILRFDMKENVRMDAKESRFDSRTKSECVPRDKLGHRDT